MPSTDYAGEDLAPAPTVFNDAQAQPEPAAATTADFVQTETIILQKFNDGFDLI